MSNLIDKDIISRLNNIAAENETTVLNCIPARDDILLPGMELGIDIARRKSIYSARKAVSEGGFIFITMQKDPSVDRPRANDIYEYGTIAYVRQVVETKSGIYRCYVTGIAKGHVEEFSAAGAGYSVVVKRLPTYEEDTVAEKELIAAARELGAAFSEYCDVLGRGVDELPAGIFDIKDPVQLYEALCEELPLTHVQQQELYELPTCYDKIIRLVEFLTYESDIIQLEARVHEKVRDSINQGQREYYIREQIRMLKEELGEEDEYQADAEECEKFRNQLYSIQNMDFTARERILEEIKRLSKMPSFSQEAALLRSYIELCLSLPWDNLTADTLDIEAASEILDEDHYGIRKVKDRVLENLAVRQFHPSTNSQILCLSGPPGVGKTSVAKSIARALGRKFVRVSLGGVRDESDIRGHRKTYIGAMPGRIIMALKQAGSSNPVMLLDEIDKMTNDFRGDPSSALLEVLDPEQNVEFRDHYTEIPFDLSRVLFITTANNTASIAPPLLDRMELIELTSYTREEKFHIAREHLIPKQLRRHGMTQSNLRINDSAIYAMIDSYTREAGVRNLEREISSICRKAAKRLLSGENKVSCKAANITTFLGNKKYTDEYFMKKPQIGCVNGLAWTSVGGVILPVEVLVLDGKGKVVVTGSLGDVMKESSSIAVSIARKLAAKYGYGADFYENKDIHIHAPEGAVPKDGPSAGVTMVTALVSALSGIKVRSDVAMTGEITLTGKVLPIGGLREKTMAAYKAGMKTVIIPVANKGDLDEIDSVIRESMEFIFAEKIEDVLKNALICEESDTPKPTPRRGRKPKQNPQTEAVS